MHRASFFFFFFYASWYGPLSLEKRAKSADGVVPKVGGLASAFCFRCCHMFSLDTAPIDARARPASALRRFRHHLSLSLHNHVPVFLVEGTPTALCTRKKKTYILHMRCMKQLYLCVFSFFLSSQLERIGFFVVDKDSTPELLVLNRTVTLREASGKTAAPSGKSRKELQASQKSCKGKGIVICFI